MNKSKVVRFLAHPIVQPLTSVLTSA